MKAIFIAVLLGSASFAQSISPDVRKLLNDYESAVQSLQTQLQIAQQDKEKLAAQSSVAQSQNAQLQKQLVEFEHNIASARREGDLEMALFKMLDRLVESDTAIAQKLADRKNSGLIDPPPPQPPLSLDFKTGTHVAELLDMVKARIRERDVLRRALLMDRLSLEGQVMLDKAPIH
jgi:outer membrane murein-binding lipoprotein Lpp